MDIPLLLSCDISWCLYGFFFMSFILVSRLTKSHLWSFDFLVFTIYALFHCLELKGVAVRMVELFNKNLYLSKDLEPQVNIHGEELLSMAANILVQVYCQFIKNIISLSFKSVDFKKI